MLQGNFGIPSLDGKIWPLLGIVFFAYKSIESILRRHLTSAVFTGLLALIIANYAYDLLPVTNHSLIWASILVVLGVGYLTHSSKFWNEKNGGTMGKKQSSRIRKSLLVAGPSISKIKIS